MGAAGPTGASGAAGLNGATGSAGPAGLNGANGAVGATGPTGATGATGFLSPVSAYVSDTTYGAGAVVFYQGSSYQSSVANNQNHVPGTDGNWTIIAQQGFAGATGATGAAGAQGIAGTAGANGATGAPGATGPQGPAGPTGPAGAQGVAGTPGANGATGAQGPAGLQGPAGPAGPTGAQGVAGTPGSPGANGASGVGTMLIANFSNSPTPFNYYAFNSSNVSSNVSFSVAQTLMPAACTFDTMYVSAVPTGGSPAADTLIYVLYVNGNSTPLQVSLTTSTTTDTATKGSMTGGSVSVAAGDGVAIGVSQSNGSPVIRSAVSVRCL